MTNKNLFDKEGSIFMGSKTIENDCNIGIFGVNYDGTTSFKPGARFGPQAIRNVSESLETYCPIMKKDLDKINYFDAGSLKIDLSSTKSVLKQVNLATSFFIDNNIKPIVLGGEHSITIGVIEALIKKYPNLILIQLDAHADLRDSFQNNKYSHACTIKRCIDLLPSKKVFQIGIRSGTQEEFNLMANNNQLIKFNTGESNIKINQILENYKNHPFYLTVDLDWFDPSLLSGTGTPEPGGFFWHDFENIIKILNLYKIVGCDIVELSPDIDNTGISSIVAAKTTRSLIMTLDNNS
tara:strand:+ start:1416 stop:2300 length:885 start_codon:yes stop_codon:yes gene_type:complete